MKHWTAVWKPAQKKGRDKKDKKNQRSVSRPKQSQASSPAPEASRAVAMAQATNAQPMESNPMTDWKVFPDKVPWIPSTPVSRHSTYRQDQGTEQESLPIPPAPILPGPPAPPKVNSDGLTTEEQQMLTHLKGMQSLGMELPQLFQQQLEALEMKSKDNAAQKVLSHKHLNQVHKYNHMVQQSAKRIQKLDAEWAAFTEGVKVTLANHASMYQACRAEMLENHNTKLQLLAAARDELSQASQVFMEQPVLTETAPPQSDVAETIQQMQQALDNAGVVDTLVTVSEGEGEGTEDEDPELMQVDERQKSAKSNRTSTALLAFRVAGSPGKVAQIHGKTRRGPTAPASPAAK